MQKVFFSVDVHGANSVWRKWLRVPELYGVNALLFCGDLTGKSLVPIIEQKKGVHKAFYFGKNWTLKTENEIKEMEKRIQDAGAYTKRSDPDEIKYLQSHPEKVESMMLDMIKKRLDNWIQELIDKVDVDKVDVIVMPGNDDDFLANDVIRTYESEGIQWCLDQAVNVLGIPMISLDYVNPTPWDTPREDSEKGMKKRIKDLIKKVNDPSASIFNFHAPPYGTMLDLAPELDANKKPVTVAGQVNFVHVGSKSVYRAIEKYQPLIGLHGHIHESYGHDKIGETPVVNPGSEYGEGILRGYIIEIESGKVNNYWKVEG